MPANWGYVIAAIVFLGYWRHLARRGRTLAQARPASRTRAA